VLDITVPVGTPVEEDADELVAAPDAVGFEIRVAECPVVAFGVPAFVVGERLFVKLPGLGPAFVRAGLAVVVSSSVLFCAKLLQILRITNPVVPGGAFRDIMVKGTPRSGCPFYCLAA